MFNFFKKPLPDSTNITIVINDKIEPIDRGQYYEKPLNRFLNKNNLGKTTGAGTEIDNDGDIKHVTLDVKLNANGHEVFKSIEDIIAYLEKRGIPKGSQILVGEKNISFGNLDGLAIHFDNIGLAPEVYKSSDINFVIETIVQLINDQSDILRYVQNPKETILYFYGASYDEMINLIKPFAESYPLFQNSKLHRITPHDHNQ
jgi:hypothetical protein